LHDGLRRDTRFITDFATVQPGAERRSSLGRSAAGRAPGHLTDRRRLLALDVAQALGVLVPGDRPLPLSLRAPVSASGTWANPQLGIDGKRLAGRLLGAAALAAAVGPLAALLPARSAPPVLSTSPSATCRAACTRI